MGKRIKREEKRYVTIGMLAIRHKRIILKKQIFILNSLLTMEIIIYNLFIIYDLILKLYNIFKSFFCK